MNSTYIKSAYNYLLIHNYTEDMNSLNSNDLWTASCQCWNVALKATLPSEMFYLSVVVMFEHHVSVPPWKQRHFPAEEAAASLQNSLKQPLRDFSRPAPAPSMYPWSLRAGIKPSTSRIRTNAECFWAKTSRSWVPPDWRVNTHSHTAALPVAKGDTSSRIRIVSSWI